MNRMSKHFRTSSIMSLATLSIAASTPLALHAPTTYAAAATACQVSAHDCSMVAAENDLACAQNVFTNNGIFTGSACRQTLTASEQPTCRSTASTCGNTGTDAAANPVQINVLDKYAIGATHKTVTLTCPGAQRVESINVVWGKPSPTWPNAVENWVRSIQLECSNGTDQPSEWLTFGRAVGGSSASFACDPGQLMNKLVFRTGAFVDAVQAQCRNAATYTSTPPVKTSGFMGGDGGEFDFAGDCGMNPQRLVAGLSIRLAVYRDVRASYGELENIEGVKVICK